MQDGEPGSSERIQDRTVSTYVYKLSSFRWCRVLHTVFLQQSKPQFSGLSVGRPSAHLCRDRSTVYVTVVGCNHATIQLQQ